MKTSTMITSVCLAFAILFGVAAARPSIQKAPAATVASSNVDPDSPEPLCPYPPPSCPVGRR